MAALAAITDGGSIEDLSFCTVKCSEFKTNSDVCRLIPINPARFLIFPMGGLKDNFFQKQSGQVDGCRVNLPVPAWDS